MNGAWTVACLAPPGYAHWRCYEDAAIGMACALRDLGHRYRIDFRIVNAPCPRWADDALVFGAHLLPRYPDIPLPDHAIIYQTEVCGSEWTQAAYCDLLRQHRVLDYSAANVEWLRSHGIAATHCPLGYHRDLERIHPADSRDIDVLFYGSLTSRREAIVRDLAQQGIAVHTVFGVYGRERDDLIARSKVVLDLKAWENSPRNDCRLQLLYANKVCVVSESNGRPLADEIRHFLGSAHAREDQAELDYAAFKLCPQADYLKQALAL